MISSDISDEQDVFALGGSIMTKSDAKIIKQSLKRILKQYRTMTAAIRIKLNALGFSMVLGGKHIKIYYGTDRSHWALIASTASDVKAGIIVATRVFRTLIVPQIS